MPSDQIPINEMNSAILIDVRTYCRKVPVKKLKLQTYEDLVNHLWQTLQRISSNCGRIDIVFNLYLDQSIKQGERMGRSKRGSSRDNNLKYQASFASQIGEVLGIFK